MLKYILKRIGGGVVTLFIVITLSFFMMRLAPGGPFSKDRAYPPEILRNIEAKYHLDKPLLVQYGIYLERVIFHFDLGPSTRYADRSVNELIASGFEYSARIGLGALIFSVFVGLCAGLIAALNHNKFLDYFPMSISMIGVSMPDFVLANILMLVFALQLGWLPVAGIDSFSGYILPSATLGLIFASSIARLTRGGMLEILGQDFVRTARAKGLSQRTILWRHTLKGGLVPVVSYLGPAIASMMTGSLIVEKVFNIPGLGRFFVDSATNRDYTLAMGSVIVFAVLIIALNIFVDCVYGLLDPRVTYD
ncbi:MAG: ABC transporter permease subunit [Deltaproteobacteria bacterium]|nr:ABC transporter permease subunit [Deltaproteobacteria bacterium]